MAHTGPDPIPRRGIVGGQDPAFVAYRAFGCALTDLAPLLRMRGPLSRKSYPCMAEHLEGKVQMKPEKDTWESTLEAARPILANLPRTEDLADLPDFEDYSLECDFCAAMRNEMEGRRHRPISWR